MLIASQTTVTTTPTLIYQGDGATTIFLHGAGGAIHIGGSDVTASNGFLMDNGDKLSFEIHMDNLYAVVANGTATLYSLVVTK